MRFAILLYLLVASSCIQSDNSNTFDRAFSENIGIDRSTPKGERLYQAYIVLKENCMSCHTGYHNDWNSNKTDQGWISSGQIEPNDSYSSSLVIRLKNIGGNMPKDKPQISEAEFDLITNWIDNI
ncbi:MAG: hypothetical protein CME70_11295 [Halobacteriovorax sp.]|nr:hypothetical protein [Halobacteriovorax sp.]|tara:strand:+ start:92932 stop:93306 length:375 start_codon:yes stop_codon:yes gene_type:complete